MDTRWKAAWVVAILLLAAGATGVMAQDGDGNESGNETANETDGNQTGNETDDPAIQPVSGEKLTYANGSAKGRYISFQLDEDDGTLSNWSYKDDPVIDEVSWDDFSADVRVEGSSFVATDAEGNQSQGDEAAGNGSGANESQGSAEAGSRSRMKLHDNPPAVTKLELRGDEEVTISFAEDLNVTSEDRRVKVSGDGFEAYLWKDQDAKESGLQVDGNQVTVSSDRKANVMFRVVSDDETDQEIAEAASQGKVAAEVNVSEDETLVSDFGEVNVSTTTRDGEVQLVLDVDVDVNVTESENETEANETGNETDGNASVVQRTVIVIDVDVDVIASDDVEIRLDGEELEEADDLEDALEVDDDESAEALVVSEADASASASAESSSKIVTSVPEGEGQTLSLTTAQSGQVDGDEDSSEDDTSASEDETEPAPTVPGFGIPVAALAIASALLVAPYVRRKD